MNTTYPLLFLNGCRKHLGRVLTTAVMLALLALVAFTPSHVARADHIGPHTTPCNAAATVGGGALGISPGPVGPPNSLGWDVGSGQCNGSFSVTSAAGFTGGALELGLRAEQRRIGQVGQTGPDDYTVLTGPDTGPPAAINRAWWNFQLSIAYGGDIDDLDALTLEISTDVGPNLPSAPVVDLLALRGIIEARNNQPNATTGFADLYQVSQNPEFGWFSPTSDTDANPTGAFDYDAPGAWRFTLTAVEGASSSSASVCIHTPGETCAPLNEAPDCTDAAPSSDALWPPNHRLKDITVDGVTDGDGDAVTITIDSIFQDEPVDSTGDGNTAPDGQGVGSDTAEVRAERRGSGNGRVYHIGFTADDGNGGSCSGTVLVGVPHSRRSTAVDDGPLYDSTTIPALRVGDDKSADVGVTIQMAGVMSDPTQFSGESVLWDFGDGTTQAGTLTAEHAYSDYGDYVVTLSAVDLNGITHDAQLMVVISTPTDVSLVGFGAGKEGVANGFLLAGLLVLLAGAGLVRRRLT